MKVENNKIVEATEDELFDVYLERGLDDIMSFTAYKEAIKRNGCVIISKEN